MFQCCKKAKKPKMNDQTVSEYLAQNKAFARGWFIQHAAELNLRVQELKGKTKNTLEPVPQLTEAPLISQKFSDALLARKMSVDQRINKRNLEGKSEVEILHELIRDIATELDLDRLCFKILLNVSILTKSDKGSLFLATGSKDKQSLVSKLFDVSAHKTMEDCLVKEENEFVIPYGVGIAGNVAQTKKAINIKDCYKVQYVDPPLKLYIIVRSKAPKFSN